MKKIIKNILTSNITAVSILVPFSICLSSCSDEKKNVDIDTLKLSSRPRYICPDKTLQIEKITSPASAVNNDTTWEVVESPIEGFTISNDGLLQAPSDFKGLEDAYVTIKATDVNKPDVSGTITIALLEKEEKDKPLIGFLGSKVDYFTREGEKASVDIEEVGDKSYKISKPIDLFIGRTNDAISFTPLVLRGYNDRMKFHLHGDDPSLHALTWIGYSDNTWTDTIPSFSVAFVQDRHDYLDVTFACDKEVTFHLDFNVWQSEIQSTPGSMWCTVPETDPHYHDLSDLGLGQYSSYIDMQEASQVTEVEDTIDNIVVYRKPYEYLDELTFKIVLPDPVYIPEEYFSVTFNHADREEIWPLLHHEGYRINATIRYNPSHIIAEEFGYDEIPLFILQAWDPLNDISPLCYCTFYARWHEPGDDYEKI